MNNPHTIYSSSMALVITFIYLYLISSYVVLSLSTTTSTIRTSSVSSSELLDTITINQLSGNWSNAKQSLRKPNCCVVSVSGLDDHISTIQQYFCGNDAPSDLDLRMRVRCGNDDTKAYADCSKIYNSVMGKEAINNFDNSNDIEKANQSNNHPCILALQELARGLSSLADGPLEGKCEDVHMRVVCASNYQAIDPMFHTDKCPLRGYVTLTGPGTEYMDESCQPWEYAALRTLGVDGLSSNKIKALTTAEELEFIVMKGDHYDDGTSQSLTSKLWSRSSACVHRSPPRVKCRRMILSLDLADGVDDQEWFEISRKREWRSGMTQRKSHLVS